MSKLKGKQFIYIGEGQEELKNEVVTVISTTLQNVTIQFKDEKTEKISLNSFKKNWEEVNSESEVREEPISENDTQEELTESTQDSVENQKEDKIVDQAFKDQGRKLHYDNESDRPKISGKKPSEGIDEEEKIKPPKTSGFVNTGNKEKEPKIKTKKEKADYSDLRSKVMNYINDKKYSTKENQQYIGIETNKTYSVMILTHLDQIRVRESAVKDKISGYKIISGSYNAQFSLDIGYDKIIEIIELAISHTNTLVKQNVKKEK